MNRPIKFRAWDKKEKRMVTEKFSVNFLGGEQLLVSEGTEGNNMGTELEYEAMQSTGLHDKNGKEIYEGDIVESYCDKERKADCCHSVHCIVWNESGFAISKNVDGYGATSFILDQKNWGDRFEIIGNIYEHPDLLR